MRPQLIGAITALATAAIITAISASAEPPDDRDCRTKLWQLYCHDVDGNWTVCNLFPGDNVCRAFDNNKRPPDWRPPWWR